MHTSTQIIAQRALPATRTKARWQPYHPMPSTASSISNSSLRSPNMNTPNISVPSPLASQTSSFSSNQSLPPLHTTTAQAPKESFLRDPSKHKFAAGLIDQAVNILSEIWRPQDIPQVFQSPPKVPTPLTTSSSTLISSCSQSISSKSPLSTSSQPPASDQILYASVGPVADLDQSLLPLKTFVHEILKRSRTSGSILQAALCYLEAVRSKVPEILHEERIGIRAHYLPDTTILPATPAELEREAELRISEDNTSSQDVMKTIQVTDLNFQGLDTSCQVEHSNSDHISVSSLVCEPSMDTSTFTPPLPSPLLCPRRTFLASLILASKFFQDKCYSNRAWAKLSGLPPREIGRCERALGQALDWRLWVGKCPVPQPAAASTTVRPVIRSQSESSLFTSPSSSRSFLIQEESVVSKTCEQDKRQRGSGSRSGLRRCSTVPDNVFTARPTAPCEIPASTSCTRDLDQDMDFSCKDPILHNEAFASSSSSIAKDVSSPRPPTPPLTHSPSSTECSLGDRTIQMSTFEDNVFPSVDGSQFWPSNASTLSSAIKAPSPDCLEGKYSYIAGDLMLGLVGLASNAHGVSLVDPDNGAYGTRYLWQEEDRFRHIEPASVH